MYILKIIMSTPLEKKFFEADRFVLKFFLSADSEKSREYTCKKKFFETVWLFQTFSRVYILKIIISIPLEKVL